MWMFFAVKRTKPSSGGENTAYPSPYDPKKGFLKVFDYISFLERS